MRIGARIDDRDPHPAGRHWQGDSLVVLVLRSLNHQRALLSSSPTSLASPLGHPPSRMKPHRIPCAETPSPVGVVTAHTLKPSNADAVNTRPRCQRQADVRPHFTRLVKGTHTPSLRTYIPGLHTYVPGLRTEYSARQRSTPYTNGD